MKVYLMRHGETDWNAQKRLQGREDIPLNERGRAQAVRMGEIMAGAGLRFDRVYSSPLSRASQTAAVIADMTGSPAPVPMDGLTEMEFGSCSGMTYQEQHEYLSSGRIIEGMEDREAAAARAWNAIIAAAQEAGDKTASDELTDSGNILVVFHGAVMATVLSRLAGREIGGGNFKLKNACVNILEYDGSRLACEAYNLSADEVGAWLKGERRDEWLLPPPQSGKLYYRTPYVKEFDATVRMCSSLGNGRYAVVLDWTAFYPEGGGQPSDTGRLGDAKVLHVEEKAGQIIHETDAYLEDGTNVHGVLDWDRRFSLMQQHTGEHIFSGLVKKHYGYDNVGFHMHGDFMTVDWNGTLDGEQLLALERETNELIWQNLPVLSLWPAPGQLDQMDYRSKKTLSGAVRIIEIPGCDICACCGTHVSRTGEIGLVKVMDFIHYKGGVRVTLTAGRCAAEAFDKRQQWINELGSIFSVPPEKVVEAASKSRKNEADLHYQLGQARLEGLMGKARAMEGSDEPVIVFEAGLSMDEARKYCTAMIDGGKGSTVLVCSENGEGFIYALGSGSMDVRQLGKRMNAELSGRGGGSGQMVQGNMKADRERIEEFFREAVIQAR